MNVTSWLERIFFRAGKGVIRMQPQRMIAPGHFEDLPTAGVDFDGALAHDSDGTWVCQPDGLGGFVWSQPGSGPAGPTGPTGPAGATGATGAAGTTDHLLLTNIGTNTHAQIDTAITNSVAHIAASNPHSGSQPLDADLTTLAANITAAGHALVDDATAGDQRTTLGLVAGGAGDIWVEKAGDTMTGTLTLSAQNIATDTTTGTKIGTATNQKLGFFNATPIVRGTAFTQTFATASHTVPAATQLAAPAGGTGTAAGGWDTAANRNLAITSINAARTDIDALKQVVNGLIDDLQALGLIG